MFTSISKGTVIKITLPENPTANDNSEITPEFFSRLIGHYQITNLGTSPSYFVLSYKIKRKLFDYICSNGIFLNFANMGEGKNTLRIQGVYILESYDLKDNEIIIC